MVAEGQGRLKHVNNLAIYNTHTEREWNDGQMVREHSEPIMAGHRT